MRALPLVGLVTALAAFAGAGCEDGASIPSPGATPTEPPAAEAALRGEVRAFPGERLVLGVSAPMVGQQTWGVDLRDAVRLAVEEYGGRVAGLAVTVDARDDGCDDPERPAAVAARFAQNPAVFAVVGPACGNGEFVAGPVYEYTSRVHVSPSATRVRLADRPLQTFFRTAWRDDQQGALLAGYAFEALRARRAFLVDDGTEYGQVVAYGFATAFNGLGGTIAGHGRADTGSMALTAAKASPDVVVFAGLAPDGAALAKALRELGYQGPILGPDALLDPQGFLAAAGSAAEGTVVLGAPPLPGAFVERFEARFGRAPASPFAAHAYDAATALLEAAGRAARQAADGAVVIANADLRAALLTLALDGLSGPLRFTAAGDRQGDDAASLGLAFYEVKDGTFVPVPDDDR
jgi:branched-chain amino acid transport system substrate-binding protein